MLTACFTILTRGLQVNQTMQKKAVLTELNRQLADMAEELQAQRDKHGGLVTPPHIFLSRCLTVCFVQACSCRPTATEACSCKLKGRLKACVSWRLTSPPKSKRFEWSRSCVTRGL